MRDNGAVFPRGRVGRRPCDHLVFDRLLALERRQNGHQRSGQAGQAEVKVSDVGLVFTRGDRQTQLLPVIDNLYRRNNDPQATVVFAKHTDQRIYLQGELGNYVRVETQTFFDGTATNP